MLVKNNVDFLFCFGDKILKPILVEEYKNRIINFHPSILPAFPGLNAIDQALKTSVQFLGNTAHFIDEGIDTGMIILQTAISRSAFEEYNSVLDLQIPMLYKIWCWLESDKIIISENCVKIEHAEKNTIFSS
jgi:phosphoribosylglycinamide formyltransferase-1